MPQLLSTGCMIACTFGALPVPFTALPAPGKPLLDGALPVATMLEVAPDVNIPSFGLCTSMGNPEVEMATMAAMGALTPMPCEPFVLVPWDPPSALLNYGGMPLATALSKCMCAWGGEISVTVPACVTVTVDG